jgi:hypothetical protein
MCKLLPSAVATSVGALCIVLASSAAIAQDNRAPQETSSALATAHAGVPTWKAIEIGIHPGVNAYRDALDAASVRIGDAADEILGRPAFRYVHGRESIELVIRSVADLGIEVEGASLADVYARARQLGLALCPPEVGLQLRLDYARQPLGEVLHIAMEPVATYAGEPTILALANLGTGPLLIGSDGRPGFMAPRTFRFVFALPQPGHDVEARR